MMKLSRVIVDFVEFFNQIDCVTKRTGVDGILNQKSSLSQTSSFSAPSHENGGEDIPSASVGVLWTRLQDLRQYKN
jgi:hypothetical protein